MEPRRRIAQGGLSGAALGLLVTTFFMVTNPRPPSPAAVVLLPLALAAIGAGLVAFAEGGRPYHLQEWVPLAPATIRRQATRWYAANGWTLQGSDDDTLAFVRGSSPPDAGCLLLLGGLPALLYLLSAQKGQTTTILTEPVPDGTELEIIVSSRDGGGQSSAARFFNSLHDLV